MRGREADDDVVRGERAPPPPKAAPIMSVMPNFNPLPIVYLLLGAMRR